jgi:hypothetical protein
MTSLNPPGFDYPLSIHGQNKLMHYFRADGWTACRQYHISSPIDLSCYGDRIFHSPEEILAGHSTNLCCLTCIKTMRYQWRNNVDLWRLWLKIEAQRMEGI